MSNKPPKVSAFTAVDWEGMIKELAPYGPGKSGHLKSCSGVDCDCRLELDCVCNCGRPFTLSVSLIKPQFSLICDNCHTARTYALAHGKKN